jgi:hypothetical protein
MPKAKAKAVEEIVEVVTAVDEVAPKDESPRARFLRLGPKRVESAIKRIGLVGNLAGSGYQCEPAEAQQIIEALFDAVHDLKRKFEKKAKGKKAGFSFKKKAA